MASTGRGQGNGATQPQRTLTQQHGNMFCLESRKLAATTKALRAESTNESRIGIHNSSEDDTGRIGPPANTAHTVRSGKRARTRTYPDRQIEKQKRGLEQPKHAVGTPHVERVVEVPQPHQYIHWGRPMEDLQLLQTCTRSQTSPHHTTSTLASPPASRILGQRRLLPRARGRS